MRIVKYSEAIHFSEVAILSSPSRRRYFKDILAHLRNLDEPTWFLLFTTSMFVAFVLFSILKIPFCEAFWVVLKAFLYKRKYLNFEKTSFDSKNFFKNITKLFTSKYFIIAFDGLLLLRNIFLVIHR
jgi:hypothetical protein